MFYRRNIYNSPFFINMEQFSSGKVMSLLETSCYLCQRRDWGIGKPFALLSQCPARDLPRRNSNRLRRKRPFLTPHLGLSDLIPKSKPIREVNEITPSYAYQ
jgi:hypothetical protein